MHDVVFPMTVRQNKKRSLEKNGKLKDAIRKLPEDRAGVLDTRVVSNG